MRIDTIWATAGAVLLGFAISNPAIAEDLTSDILSRFVTDYAQDPMIQSETFGIEVDGARWHVVANRADRDAQLHKGFPESPVFYFKTTAEILQRIDAGQLTGLTAMAAATSADITPLDVLYSEGYTKPDDYDARLRPLIFHFWTRGLPEVVPFGAEYSRIVHGAPGTVMYYAKDFRSAVYHIPPRLGADQAPTMAVPFPRLLVTLAGTMTGTVGGAEFVAPAGQFVFVPPNLPAHVWNDGDQQLDLMFLMFGDGA
ncbi:MAG: hypothetical protein AAFO81_00670 [Pseudomonadota bacterium]